MIQLYTGDYICTFMGLTDEWTVLFCGEIVDAKEGSSSKFMRINKTYYLHSAKLINLVHYICDIQLQQYKLTMRICLNKLPVYFKTIPKISNSAIDKPDSNIIVDPGYFRQSGLIPYVTNRFRNSNAFFQINRGADKFVPALFEKQAIQKYNLMKQYYDARNYREITNMLSETMLKIFKSACKATPKDQPIDLGWRFIPNVNSVKIVQARVHEEKISNLKVTDRWFQLTCKFTNPEGQQIYNVLEKHEKNKQFKFVKIDL